MNSRERSFPTLPPTSSEAPNSTPACDTSCQSLVVLRIAWPSRKAARWIRCAWLSRSMAPVSVAGNPSTARSMAIWVVERLPAEARVITDLPSSPRIRSFR